MSKQWLHPSSPIPARWRKQEKNVEGPNVTLKPFEWPSNDLETPFKGASLSRDPFSSRLVRLRIPFILSSVPKHPSFLKLFSLLLFFSSLLDATLLFLFHLESFSNFSGLSLFSLLSSLSDTRRSPRPFCSFYLWCVLIRSMFGYAWNHHSIGTHFLQP